MSVQNDYPTPSCQGGTNFPYILTLGKSHCFPETGV